MACRTRERDCLDFKWGRNCKRDSETRAPSETGGIAPLDAVHRSLSFGALWSCNHGAMQSWTTVQWRAHLVSSENQSILDQAL